MKAAGAPAAAAFGEVEGNGVPVHRALDRTRPDLDPISRVPDSGAPEDAWRMQIELRAESVAADTEQDEEIFDVREFDDARRVAEGQLESDVRERFAWLVARRAERALTEPDDPRAPQGTEAFVDLCDAIQHAEEYLEMSETKERVGEIRERVLSDVRPPAQGEGSTGADEAVEWDEESVIAFDELAGRYDLIDRVD